PRARRSGSRRRRGHEVGRSRRHGHSHGRARRGAGARKAAHAGRRLGAWAPRLAVQAGCVTMAHSPEGPEPVEPRRARPRTRVDDARRAAFDALLLVETDDAYLNLTLPRLLSERRLDSRDAAFATEIANGTMRMRAAYDAVIGAQVRGGLTS